jgi:transposase
MTQRDRDRLVVLRKAQRKLITQRQAAEELGLTERHVGRLLVRLKEGGDGALLHRLRGRKSNRKLSGEVREQAVRVLSQADYRDFGPTLASEYLLRKHKLRVGRETLRQWMMAAGLWQGRRRRMEPAHLWRPRRSCRGELVQWDTSDHDWLEGRGGRIYLIHMIDDATSTLTARFVEHDSTEENMRLLWEYLERHGRPVAFYTDKASLFQNHQKRRRDEPGVDQDPVDMPPTQIGRALRELGIAWIAAHSPQAKGRIERSFLTAQDRLVKGLRLARARTLQQAERYLQEEFVPWWNQHLVVTPAHPADAHKPLAAAHELAAILSHVETRQVFNNYTIQYQRHFYRIAKEAVRSGLRGSTVRVEQRLDGTLAVRWRDVYLPVSLCPRPAAAEPEPPHRRAPKRQPASSWMKGFLQRPGPSIWQALRDSNQHD